MYFINDFKSLFNDQIWLKFFYISLRIKWEYKSSKIQHQIIKLLLVLENVHNFCEAWNERIIQFLLLCTNKSSLLMNHLLVVFSAFSKNCFQHNVFSLTGHLIQHRIVIFRIWALVYLWFFLFRNVWRRKIFK